MKLYLISNASKFHGAVQVVFNAEAKLMKVDFSNSSLGFDGIDKMLKVIPPDESKLQEAFKSKDTIIVEGDFQISFEDFSREYPYKRNTHLAREYWPKMSKEAQAQAFIAATSYRKYLSRPENEWQKPMIADKWLKTKQFLNDWKTL